MPGQGFPGVPMQSGVVMDAAGKPNPNNMFSPGASGSYPGSFLPPEMRSSYPGLYMPDMQSAYSAYSPNTRPTSGAVTTAAGNSSTVSVTATADKDKRGSGPTLNAMITLYLDPTVKNENFKKEKGTEGSCAGVATSQPSTAVTSS